MRSFVRKFNLAALLVLFGLVGIAMAPPAKPEADASTSTSAPASGGTQDRHTGSSASGNQATGEPTLPDYLRTDDIPIEAHRSILPSDKFGEIVRQPGIENRVLSGDLDENYVDPFSDEFKQVVVPVIPF